MTTAFLAVACGLILLVWSADRFIEGSSATARNLGMPPLLIGMVIVGFRHLSTGNDGFGSCCPAG